jgi:DNA-binding transcriptional ArsR family regulator
MGLEDRIREEMVRDVGSVLDDQFDRANRHLSLTEDGEVVPESYDGEWKERLLVELTGKRYAHRAELIETPGCAYDEMYELVTVDDSTVRNFTNELQDDGLVTKGDESGEWQLVVRRLPEVLDRLGGDE